MKVHISYQADRGTWLADYRLNGVRKKPSFETKTQAEAHRDEILGNITKAKARLMALTRQEQAELIELLDEAEAGGFTIREAFSFFKTHRSMPAKSFTVRKCFDDFMAEKRTMRLSGKTVAALNGIVGRFVDTCSDELVNRVTRENALQWLQNPAWGPETFNTYVTALNTFFRWCVDTDRLIKSPTSKIKKIKRSQMPHVDRPPAILDVKPLEKLLVTAWKHDKQLLRSIVCGAFGGLRPERESRQLQPKDFESNQILVRGATAKDRARRYVEINPTLRAWLKLCPKIRNVKNFRRRWDLLRLKAGLIKLKKVDGKERSEVEWVHWGHDCLRHTFASNYLPVYGAEKTIEQLGHGDYDMLFGHYRALRSKSDAEKFWNHFLKLAKKISAR